MSISRKLALSALLLTGLSVPCQSINAEELTWGNLASILYQNRHRIPGTLSRNWHNITLSTGIIASSIYAGRKMLKKDATKEDRNHAKCIFSALGVASLGVFAYRKGLMSISFLNEITATIAAVGALSAIKRPEVLAGICGVVGLSALKALSMKATDDAQANN